MNPAKHNKSARSTIVRLAVLFVLLGVGGFLLYRHFLRSRDHSPTSAPSRPGQPDNSAALAGQALVNETKSIPDGGSWKFTVPTGHYRIRLTSDEEIKARWEGVSCYASPGKTKSYEATCDPAAEVTFIVENPSRLNLGKSARVTLSIVTR